MPLLSVLSLCSAELSPHKAGQCCPSGLPRAPPLHGTGHETTCTVKNNPLAGARTLMVLTWPLSNRILELRSTCCPDQVFNAPFSHRGGGEHPSHAGVSLLRSHHLLGMAEEISAILHAQGEPLPTLTLLSDSYCLLSPFAIPLSPTSSSSANPFSPQISLPTLVPSDPVSLERVLTFSTSMYRTA